MNGCLPSYRCSISAADLTTAQTWIDTLKPSDDPRAKLQVGLLRGWWIVGTYSLDILQQRQAEKPVLDVEDALRYLRAQFVRVDEPLMQAGFLYAQAKVALWAQDLDRAIEALMFVERIEESVLTSEIFAWLGALEEARGRLDTARTYYSRVRHGAPIWLRACLESRGFPDILALVQRLSRLVPDFRPVSHLRKNGNATSML